ncbi:MAG: IS4 family transposase [bacterium]|nr:MAG: IS4 family transposase [bacterium]KAF0149684.1 MAG: IS4 family transposase [bacterium]KAF0169350.1 MAG: IS4 family transposase [bacterium]TXT21376.1 MAG: IS4 family transposase [bacterium]
MDHSKRQRLTGQVKRFCGRFAQGAGAALGRVIPQHCLLQWLKEEAGDYRERIYDPLQTLALFIEQVLGADHSCQDAVARGMSQRVALGQSPCSLNNGPYCKARARLALNLIERLGREVGERLRAAQPEVWRWRGREVKLIDGTTVSMPDTAANQAEYPQSRTQQPDLGFPLMRLVAIISLSCGAVLEWATGPCKGKRTGETAMLWQLAHRMRPGDVVIADRYFSGYFLLAWLIRHGVDVVVRQHQLRHTDFCRGRQLGAKDHVVTWARPARPSWMDEATYTIMPESLILREAQVDGLILVTTLIDARQVSKRELLGLYHARWHIELDLRSIKTVMQMDVLRCKSPAMVKKEIAVHLLAYNLVRAVMAQSAFLGHVLPRQLSFKAALQLICAFEENLRHAPQERMILRRTYLLAGIAQVRLHHRPDRVEPRAVKRRTQQHPLMTRPRHILRTELLKQRQARHEEGLIR